jgi:ubiquitin C-terminal hydrolase
MAGKTMEIYRLPDIFVVQLKRFTKHKIGIKLDIMIDYPVEGLDMSPFVKIDPQDKIYDLFGVVCHVGMIACAGHYTAFCLNPVDMKWYYYDDANVREVKKEQVVTRNAYILFYKKRSLKNDLATFDFSTKNDSAGQF